MRKKKEKKKRGGGKQLGKRGREKGATEKARCNLTAYLENGGETAENGCQVTAPVGSDKSKHRRAGETLQGRGVRVGKKPLHHLKIGGHTLPFKSEKGKPAFSFPEDREDENKKLKGETYTATTTTGRRGGKGKLWGGNHTIK